MPILGLCRAGSRLYTFGVVPPCSAGPIATVAPAHRGWFVANPDITPVLGALSAPMKMGPARTPIHCDVGTSLPSALVLSRRIVITLRTLPLRSPPLISVQLLNSAGQSINWP
jgi:hypothetical protein